MLKLLFIFLFFASCATGNPPSITGTPHRTAIHGAQGVEAAAENVCEPSPMVIFTRSERALAMHEPYDGVYIGAWLGDDIGIRGFEYGAGRGHAVFVYEMHLCGEVPVEWLLQCKAAGAVPLLVILPPIGTEHEPFKFMLVDIAERLGQFNMPMFICFFPLGLYDTSLSAAAYTAVFNMARDIFRVYAPYAAFVWGAPSHTATARHGFFPGWGAVDWVALPMFITEAYAVEGYLLDFAAFYDEFSAYAPIMLLPFGVSHFSRDSHSYRLNEAAADIGRVYTALLQFPRVGLIVYGEGFNIKRTLVHDFSVSVERETLDAYRDIIAFPYFLCEVERHGKTVAAWERLPQSGYFYQNEIFIPVGIVENNFYENIKINDKNFTRAGALKNIDFCAVRSVIFIENLY